MPSPRPPEMSKDAFRVIRDTLKKHGRDGVEQQLAEKVGKYQFMNQFFFRFYQTYAAVKRRYDHLLEYVVSLLRAQADYELSEQGVTGK